MANNEEPRLSINHTTERTNSAVAVFGSIVVFLIALGYHISIQKNPNPDDLNYMRFGYFFAFADGVKLEVSSQMLSQNLDQSIFGYPVGTSYILAFLQLLGFSPFLAFSLASAAVSTVLYNLFRQYSLLFGRIRETIILLFSLPFPFFLSYAYLSNKLALVCFIFACYKISKTKWSERQSLSHLLLLAFLCTLPSFFRYSFYPLVFAIPFGLLLVFVFNGSQKISVRNTLVLTCLMVIVGGLNAAYQSMATGKHLYLNDAYAYQKDGLYWENMLLFDPFVLNTFIDMGYVARILEHLGLDAFTPIVSVLVVFLSIGLVLFAVKFILLYRSSKPVWLLCSIFASFTLANILLLSCISLMEAPQLIGGELWSYVGETRYYSSTMFFIFLVFVSMLFSERLKFLIPKQYVAETLKAGFIATILFSIALDFYSSILRNNSTPLREDRAAIYDHLSEHIGQSDETVVFGSNNGGTSNYMSLLGVSALRTNQGTYFNEKQMSIGDIKEFNSQTKTHLFVELKDKDSLFIEQFKPKKILDLNNGALFYLLVRPTESQDE